MFLMNPSGIVTNLGIVISCGGYCAVIFLSDFFREVLSEFSQYSEVRSLEEVTEGSLSVPSPEVEEKVGIFSEGDLLDGKLSSVVISVDQSLRPLQEECIGRSNNCNSADFDSLVSINLVLICSMRLVSLWMPQITVT